MNKYARLFERAVQSVDYWTQISIPDVHWRCRFPDGATWSQASGHSVGDWRVSLLRNQSPSRRCKFLPGNYMNKFALAVGGRVKVRNCRPNQADR